MCMRVCVCARTRMHFGTSVNRNQITKVRTCTFHTAPTSPLQSGGIEFNTAPQNFSSSMSLCYVMAILALLILQLVCFWSTVTYIVKYAVG